MTTSLIALGQINKFYGSGTQRVQVLSDISLTISEGDFMAIMGPSGSGKSTLLNILGLLDGFDDGSYLLNGNSVAQLDPVQSAQIRNQFIGFVFQSFNLLPFLSAWENVALPLTYRQIKPKEREEKAREYLNYVGLGSRADHRPAELSGGQCQRVAIARALVTDPKVIFADEPTGALDSKTSVEIMSLFEKVHGEGCSLVMVTHSDEVAAAAGKIVRVMDGQIQ